MAPKKKSGLGKGLDALFLDNSVYKVLYYILEKY